MYLEIIKGLEGNAEMDDELGLYNKAGDLYLKVQNVNAAVEMYERAVNRYTESGFPNNAIALCNKILRSAPGRNHIYLKLAQLMVQRGFVAEAKKNFVEYAERMSAAGKLDEAFVALKRFADISPENEEIRLMLAEQLKASARDDEAREQIEKLLGEAGGSAGASERMMDKVRAVDPEYDLDNAIPADAPQQPAVASKGDLVFISLEDEAAAAPDPGEELAVAPIAGLEEPLDGMDDTVLVDVEAIDDIIDAPLNIEKDVGAGMVDLEVEDLGGELDDLAAPAVDIPIVEVPSVETGVDAGEVAPLKLETDAVEVSGDVEVVPPPDAFGDMELDDVDGSIELPPLELDDEEIDLPALEIEPALGLEEDKTAPIVLPAIEDLASGEAELATVGPTVAELEDRVQTQPENPLHHRQLAEALLESGEQDRALSEFNRALDLFEGRDEWGHASGLIDEMLRLDPGSVTLHQKRVEIAYKGGDRSELISAYLDLADALFRAGDIEKSEAIYRRVVDHDPGNQAAMNALASLAPIEESEPEPEPEPELEIEVPLASEPELLAFEATAEAVDLETPAPVEMVEEVPPPAPAPAAASTDYIDLGGFIMGDDDLEIKDTRMKIEEDAPTGDEQADFDQMLRQFKRGIEENIEEGDGQSHYDLGVAFKEMGLVDEAIGEFQKSLRGADTRLASAEMLGHCFIEKGQLEVASTVLRRAIESDKSADGAKIGLLYWLARCEEDNARPQEALKYYQRVVAVDVNFQDVGARVDALVKAGG